MGAVRWFCDVGPPADTPGAGAVWRTVATRAVAAATGRPPGRCTSTFHSVSR